MLDPETGDNPSCHGLMDIYSDISSSFSKHKHLFLASIRKQSKEQTRAVGWLVGALPTSISSAGILTHSLPRSIASQHNATSEEEEAAAPRTRRRLASLPTSASPFTIEVRNYLHFNTNYCPGLDYFSFEKNKLSIFDIKRNKRTIIL